MAERVVRSIRNLILLITSFYIILIEDCLFCIELIGTHSNIKILDLSHNNITKISKQYFKPAFMSLTHLYLNYNNILNATRDMFGNLPHLQWLDLSHNQIGEIDYNTFRDAKQLQVN